MLKRRCIFGSKATSSGCLKQAPTTRPSAFRFSGKPGLPCRAAKIRVSLVARDCSQWSSTRHAVRAAREIQRRWHLARETLGESLGLVGDELGVGIGIDRGDLSFGEFGRSHRDVTAIGTVVNTASRVQSAARRRSDPGHAGSLSARQVRPRGQPGPGLSAQGFSGPDRALCGLSGLPIPKRLP